MSIVHYMLTGGNKKYSKNTKGNEYANLGFVNQLLYGFALGPGIGEKKQVQ